ncbi:MAG: thiol reductant ABC exporter subunit CydD [Anaerolineaceae bacterium]|nr:thiol reductant ABC exporter subunit CydD [Anaerolineaceae bacterium]
MYLDPRLLRLARPAALKLILAIFGGLSAALLAVFSARALSRIIAAVFLGGLGLTQVQPLLSGLLALILARAACSLVGEAAASAAAAQVKATLRERLFSRLVELGPVALRGKSTGELSATALQGVEALDAYFAQYLPQVALAGLIPLGILLLVFPLDPLSGVILLVTGPLIPFFMALIGRTAERLTQRQWTTLNRMSAYFLDTLQGLRTLKALGRSAEQAGRIATVSERYRDTTLGVLRITFLSALTLELLGTISTAMIAVQVGLRLLYGQMGFEEAFFLLVIAPDFYLPLRTLGLRFHAAMNGMTAAKKIWEVLGDQDSPSAPTSADQTVPLLADNAQVIFDNVSFAYPGVDQEAVRQFNLELHPGTLTALVGPSGAGKTTLAWLLLGFLRPQTGSLRINGHSLDELGEAAWRAGMAWVPQHPHLFHDSLAANLRIAEPQATPEQLWQALRLARLDEWAASLPEGLDTPVGEGGARLSGGQAQRLALARAFLRNAPLLVLDEPTAHLDLPEEARLEATLRELCQTRTVLIIAHRITTVRQADWVVLLEDGQINEQGRPEELLKAEGAFARLAQAFGGSAEEYGKIRMVSDAPPQERISGPSNTFTPSQSQNRISNLSILGRLLGFLGPFAGSTVLSILLSVATLLSGIGLLGASAYLIASAALHPSIAALQVAIVGVRAFGIGRGVFRYLERLVSHSVNFRLLARLRVWFYRALEPLAPARLEQQRGGDLLNRITGDIDILENFYVRAVAPPIAAAIVTAGMGWFTGRYHPALGELLAGGLLLAGIGLPLLTHTLSRAAGKTESRARSALSAALVDGIQGLPDLLAFNAADRQAARLSALSREHSQTHLRLAWSGALGNAAGLLLTNLTLWVLLLAAIPLVTVGAISGVDLAVLSLLALASFEAVTPLSLAAQNLESCLQAARRLFELVQAKPAVTDPVQPLPAPTSMALQARDLTFHYAPEQPAALRNVTFDLPPAKRVALVGPSGAGKSTLARLLLRFWDCPPGSLLLDGQDIRAYANNDVRAKIALVDQHTYLFNNTLRVNLLLAQPRAEESALWAALRDAQLESMASQLPQGLDTWLEEGGARLSGGERQRVAAARALLRNVPLLILDEPAANLDAHTGRLLLDALLETLPGRSLLYITHWLAGLERMDEVWVMEEGQITARGTHAQLLAQGGWYARAWQVQQSVLG